jgi:beta-glucosidase/6-phospho-beta-glucosidase/beta-galactosidase
MGDRWFEDGALHLGLGIEDTFVPQTRAGERAIDEYELTEHYDRFPEDFALAADVGAEYLRWGVPWYRVQPEVDRWDWSWTDRALEAMTDCGLRPIVDLVHYGTPLWLPREFAHADYPRRVAEYAARFAQRYADLAVDYTPLNEPVVHALFSGEYGYWPPYLTGAQGFTTIAVNLARGVVLTQRAVADVLGERATFVHVEAAMAFVGDDAAPEHRAEAERLRLQVHLVEDLVTGRVGGDHPAVPQLRAAGVGDDDLAWFAASAVRPDVMGVNYYPRISTEVFEPGVRHAGGFADPRPAVDRGTAGLSQALREFAGRYGAPVMVSETCVTSTVDDRVRWLDDSVAAVGRLRDEGLPVVGYTWWPLLDMYEWTWRHSRSHRREHLLPMGLFDLVETPGGLARRRNAVADRFESLARHTGEAVNHPARRTR